LIERAISVLSSVGPREITHEILVNLLPDLSFSFLFFFSFFFLFDLFESTRLLDRVIAMRNNRESQLAANRERSGRFRPFRIDNRSATGSREVKRVFLKGKSDAEGYFNDHDTLIKVPTS